MGQGGGQGRGRWGQQRAREGGQDVAALKTYGRVWVDLG